MPVHAEFYCRGCDKKGGVGGRTNPDGGGVVGPPVRDRINCYNDEFLFDKIKKCVWYYFDPCVGNDRQEGTLRYFDPGSSRTIYAHSGEFDRTSHSLSFYTTLWTNNGAVGFKMRCTKGTTNPGAYALIQANTGGQRKEVKIVQEASNFKIYRLIDGVTPILIETTSGFIADFYIYIKNNKSYYKSDTHGEVELTGVSSGYGPGFSWTCGSYVYTWEDFYWQGDKDRAF